MNARTGGAARGRPSQRIRVTAPRTAARPLAGSLSPRREIDEQTGVGEVYMRSLVRAQLRLGLSVLAMVSIALGSLPLIFTLDPRLGATRVLSVPLPWLIVGVSIYPLLLAAAWWHVHAAERAERDFTEIVERY
ncbi:MAG TPA: hypothetical protein VI248_02570 [Kineosporiaceae bacterium]